MGNIETARVSLALNREVFNFGFSGNCEMETNVAQYMVTMPPPAVFILDCNWNMNADSVSHAAVPFVAFLRKNWPKTVPIVMKEGLPFGRNWAVPASAAQQTAENAALRAAYNNLTAAGDAHLTYVTTSQLFGAAAALDTGTAGGLHASDQGMHDMAAALLAVVKPLLVD